MKITMYKLLGLIKDGKTPKEIKYDNRVYIFDDTKDNYYENDTCSINWDYVAIYGLNEEEKKIPEKLDIYDELQTLLANGGGSYDHNIHKMFKKIELKQNEIIDYLKSKGDE